MDNRLKRSMPARIVASSFIILILTGNYWVVEIMLGRPGNKIVITLFELGVIGVLLGGLGLAYTYFNLPEIDSDESPDDE